MTTLSRTEDAARSLLSATRPVWSGMRRVGEVARGCGRTVFHAGPPFASALEIPAPIRNSIYAAAVYEGWADDFASAAALLRAGVIRSAAAQDHDLLVPLAGVLSPSMAVLELRDGGRATAKPFHVAINEGQVHATRLGRLDSELPAHLSWLNGPFADWLAECTAGGPIELAPLIARSLREGDDGHARTVAGSRLLADVLLSHTPPGPEIGGAREFLAAAPAFALNP